MQIHGTANPATTVGFALAAGMLAQSLARHLRVPGIVLLLGAGLVLGPDGLGIVHPGSLGSALQILVGFAVAVILFEGGLNLNLRRLRREARVIRRLLTVGALVTAVTAALASWLLMGWDWRVAVPFGALVIVTGPTVITPLLRRMRLKHNVATVLEAEGVLIDAIGAVLAVVAVEVVIVPLDLPLREGIINVVSRLGFGLACGTAGGFLLALLLRVPRIVPEGLQNVFTLSLVLALYQASDAVFPESGIAAVTAAGLVVGNLPGQAHRDLQEFKEQLTVLLIGMLFVLLAADVRLDDLRALGTGGVATVACLMFVIRPLNVTLSTLGSSLTGRERVFLSWLAPRGVVAAAIASLFAQTLETAGIPGGRQLQALVFLVIASTVVIQGLTGGFVARRLGLRRPASQGYVVFGANELGHTLGRLLRDVGEEVVFIDSNPGACRTVSEDGFKVVYGNVLEERTLQRARLDERRACLAVTPNEEANLILARTAVTEFKVLRAYVATDRGQMSVTEPIVRKAGAELLFGAQRDLELWMVRLRRGITEIESWSLSEPAEEVAGSPFDFPELLLLPLVLERGKGVVPVHGGRPLRKGDRVRFAILQEALEEGREWLRGHGFVPAEPAEPPEPTEEKP